MPNTSMDTTQHTAAPRAVLIPELLAITMMMHSTKNRTSALPIRASIEISRPKPQELTILSTSAWGSPMLRELRTFAKTAFWPPSEMCTGTDSASARYVNIASLV